MFMNYRLRILLILMFEFLVSAAVWGQELVLRKADTSYGVNYPLFFKDREGTLKIDDIINNHSLFKKPEAKVPNFFGDMSKAIWFHFKIDNNSSENHWYLQIKGGYISNIDLYEMTGPHSFKRISERADRDFAKRNVKTSSVLLPLNIKPGTPGVYYMRVTSNTFVRASMKVTTLKEVVETNTREGVIVGVLGGVVIALLIYNLFLFFYFREIAYFYYVGYTFFYLLNNLMILGYILPVFPGLNFLNIGFNHVMLCIFGVLFTNSFLQTKIYVPFIYKIRWLILFSFGITLVLSVTGYSMLAVQIVSVQSWFMFVYWMYAGLKAYLNKFQPGLYFFIAFTTVTMVTIVYNRRVYNSLEENFLTDSILLIGTALEVIILSFALASKINFYKREKEKVQKEFYAQSVSYSRELIGIQEAERKRIASELHDSVGQKLVLIKNQVLLFQSTHVKQNENAINLAENVADTIQEVRNISYGLRPYQMDLLGLTQSIKSLVEEVMDTVDIRFTLDIDNIDNVLDKDVEINLYRIIQECLNNIVKHARANECIISIKKESGNLHILITDNGIGFDPSIKRNGFGLRGMQERLNILNGTIQFQPASPSGMTVNINVPLKK